MPNIFYFDFPFEGMQHGIGTYFKHLLPQVHKYNPVTLVKVTFGENGNVARYEKSNYNVIEVVLPSYFSEVFGKQGVTFCVARKIMSILSLNVDIHDQDIFHINSVLEIYLAKVLSEYTNKIVYTQHVSLWRIHYSNDEKRFLEDWNRSNKPKGDKNLTPILADKEICEIADQVICLTNDNIKTNTTYYNIPLSKLNHVKNGYFLEEVGKQSKSDLKMSFGFNKKEFIFLFVGRLIKQKGCDLLIKAFQVLNKKHPNTRLLIVGRGDYNFYLEQTSGLCGKVSFTGFLSSEQVNNIYQFTDVGVCPSENEQSSYTMLEMIANNIPLITSNIEAFAGTLEHENTALIMSNTTDVNSKIANLVTLMERMIVEKETRANIRKNAKRLFQKNFTAEIMAKNTYEIYNKITAR